MKTQLLPEGNVSSMALSRNCWIVCFGIWRWGWWSFSLLKITWRPFLFHTFIENPFKVFALWKCCIFLSLLPMTDVLNSSWFFEGFHMWLTALLVTNLSHYLRWLHCSLWWFSRQLYHQLPGPLFSTDLPFCLSHILPLSLAWPCYSLESAITN